MITVIKQMALCRFFIQQLEVRASKHGYNQVTIDSKPNIIFLTLWTEFNYYVKSFKIQFLWNILEYGVANFSRQPSNIYWPCFLLVSCLVSLHSISSQQSLPGPALRAHVCFFCWENYGTSIFYLPSSIISSELNKLHCLNRSYVNTCVIYSRELCRLISMLQASWMACIKKMAVQLNKLACDT